MRYFILLASLVLNCSVADAQGRRPSALPYTCLAKANPTRGFEFEFKIELSDRKLKSEIFIETKKQKKLLGLITEMDVLERNNPATGNAFSAILGFLNEEDVSGVPAKDLKNVNKIEYFKSLGEEDEITLFNLFNGSKQVGGSIVISGLGTACVPKK